MDLSTSKNVHVTLGVHQVPYSIYGHLDEDDQPGKRWYKVKRRKNVRT